METVSFGQTGLKVSKLCFGTMTLGASSWKPWALDEAASRPILKRAVDLGFTFFDMANWYSIGEGERVVASFRHHIFRCKRGLHWSREFSKEHPWSETSA